MTVFDAVDGAIRAHLAELRKPGVLTARPGYRFANGWITREPAVVVTAGPGADVRAIPSRVGGYPTDVRTASRAEVLRHSDPRGFAEALDAAPARSWPAYFPLERDVATGATLPRPAAAKPTVPYSPPAGATLAPVRDRMSLTCSASPDSGWTVLSAFLAATRQALTVGMYDFTSAHVLAALKAALSAPRRLSLVLDDPPRNPAADQSDDETAAALAALLGDRQSFAWAAEASDPHVARAVFPNAYHIKVAVRDHEALWLSSGNWNNANQPVIDPWGDPSGAAAIAARSDRDWHVVVEHPGLARTLETYLLHDLEVAKGLQAGGVRGTREAAAAALLGPEAAALPGTPPLRFHRPLRLEDQVIDVRPVLTPDAGAGNYAERLLELIDSATERLYVQTQYVHPPQAGEDAPFGALVEAVGSKMKAGLDVRVILGEHETAPYLEKLQEAGWDMGLVRIQRGVHNKGFVVDSRAVAVGSQNWSGDGALRNRDATLVIRDPRAAQYFEQILVEDWEGQARQRV